MLKQKISGSVQEVILADFPDDDNTVTTTVTKSRRVSFGPNFVKEFIVDSAVSAQCMSEYEQPFPSSDSSSTDSSHSAVGQSTFVVHENAKVQKSVAGEAENGESRAKAPKFASTICFSADSPTADMEFTEGCITLAKSILDKKNKEMTVFIQAKPKGQKEEEKAKEEETNYLEGSQFDMSMTRCLKSKERKREEKRFVSEKTKIFGKFDDEMSMTRCEKFINDDESDNSWEDSKENRMPLDAIMRHLDKDSSDSDLFNPERSFGKLLGANPFDLSDESEKLNLNESMEISGDFQGAKVPGKAAECEEKAEELAGLNLVVTPVTELQPSLLSDEDKVENDVVVELESCESSRPVGLDAVENLQSFGEEIGAKETESEEAMDISVDMAVEAEVEGEMEANAVAEVEAKAEAKAEAEAETKAIAEMEVEAEAEMEVEAEAEAEANSCEHLDSRDVMDGSSAAFQSNLSETSENPDRLIADAVEEMKSEEICVSPTNPCQDDGVGSVGIAPVQEDDSPREPSLGDLKVIESLKEQSKEPGCLWYLKDLQHPRKKAQGLLSFGCRLLESTTSIEFSLKMSDEDGLDSCSVVTGSGILPDEEKQCRVPEYTLAVGFGFEELKKCFEERRQRVETIRHVPYFLDQVNSFLSKMNAYLRQIHSILTSYPGSRLTNCRLHFRLFSFPIFFSCVVAVDLSNMFRLSRASLSFEHDFGCLDEKKMGEIFEECLKRENSLCEFVVQSTRYLVELERQSGFLSKRGHIRLLPDELRS